jgi:hypothetical protein
MLPRLRDSRSGVFSEPSSVAHRVTPPRLVCCQATAINTWMMQEWGRVTWPHRQWHHAFQQGRNNWRVSCVSDQGFIGEIEASSGGVISQFSMGDNHGWFVVGEELIVWIEDFKCEWKTFFVCNIWSVWFNETVIIPVLRSVARRRLVETENPSACATVNWKVCISAIALYCYMYV